VDLIRGHRPAGRSCSAGAFFSSGSLPGQNLPTTLAAIASPHHSAAVLAGALRGAATPVFTRIGDDRVLIDPRTLLNDDEAILVETLVEILKRT